MTTYQLRRWKHPRTGIRRIYVNKKDLDAKIWIEQVGTQWVVRYDCTKVNEFGHIIHENAWRDETDKPYYLAIEVCRRAITDYLGYPDDYDLTKVTWAELWKNALDE